MRLVNLYNTVYLLPTLDISYDNYYEGGLAYVEFNISWLKWSLSISIKSEKE
jgi:hypothetical protein